MSTDPANLSDRDLMFVTGAPGSRWSLVVAALDCVQEINATGTAPTDMLAAELGDDAHELAHLDSLGRDDLLRVLARRHRDLDGVLSFASHHFARQLPFLAATFPGARLVLVRSPDDACLRWWMDNGGFDLGFPDYSWYSDMAGMHASIQADNAGITTFAAANGVTLRRRGDFRPLLKALGLTLTAESIVATSVGMGVTVDVDKAEALVHGQAGVAQVGWWRGP